MNVDKNHPRFISLTIREKLVAGVGKGITSQAGLIAHGRGEAFDYLLGEKTHDFAKKAIQVSACHLLMSKNPILSINGNAAALCLKEFVDAAVILRCKIEVNLFHYTKEREKNIEKAVSKLDSSVLFSSKKRKTMIIPNIASRRKIALRDGIGKSDTVFVPLEDGDRSCALVSLGKTVLTIDLNPLSRTAQSSTVTIVDNITRAMPELIKQLTKLKETSLQEKQRIIKNFDNKKNLSEATKEIIRYLHLSSS